MPLLPVSRETATSGAFAGAQALGIRGAQDSVEQWPELCDQWREPGDEVRVFRVFGPNGYRYSYSRRIGGPVRCALRPLFHVKRSQLPQNEARPRRPGSTPLVTKSRPLTDR